MVRVLIWHVSCPVLFVCMAQGPFRAPKEKVSRDDVEKRVLHEEPKYSDKFSAEAKEICVKVCTAVLPCVCFSLLCCMIFILKVLLIHSSCSL